MHLPPFDYVRPDHLDHALALLAEEGSRAAVLAGGTDLVIGMRQRLLEPRLVVGIGALPELKTFEVTADGGLRIGAGCTLSDLAAQPVLRQRFPSLAAAIRSVGSRHVRNAATLGGNLALPTRCWYTNQGEEWRRARPPCFKTGGDVCFVIRSAKECFALNNVDSAPALMTLGARVTIARAGGSREVALTGFYCNDGLAPNVLVSGELITMVHVPPHQDRTVFIKLAARTGLDYGLATVAAAVSGSNRRISSARLVVGSVVSWPAPLVQAARIIEEGGLTAATIEAAAEAARADLGEVTNLYSSSGYKRRVVRALVRRALDDLRRQKGPAGEAA
ncbi:MAG: FAD binding domain-containing protein [Gammaproteobacteria bacterium]|nr:MAG: FAD binding domain-containing protein [Gammaproteobacteria bacterium]